MSEIRKDFLLDRFVLIAPERAHRPMPRFEPHASDDEDPCPFCPGHEAHTPPEVLALGRPGSGADTPGWSVRVVPNKFPALRESPLAAPGAGSEERVAAGFHEVVIESPDHTARWHEMPAAQRGRVLEAVLARMTALHAEPGIDSVLVFRNEGRAAGATLSHPHLQILALRGGLPSLDRELEAGRAVADALGVCPWCRLLDRELDLGVRVVEAGSLFAVVAPYAPRFPYETWILPLAHGASLLDADPETRRELGECLADTVARLKRRLGDVAYNWFLHSAGPRERHPGFHWHLELLPRTVHAAGFEWGSGMWLHPVAPEAAAAALRAAAP